MSNVNDMDDGTTMDLHSAGTIANETRERAERALAVGGPVLFASGGLVLLFGYGAIWLSVRDQRPYNGPTGAAIAVLLALVTAAVIITASVVDVVRVVVAADDRVDSAGVTPASSRSAGSKSASVSDPGSTTGRGPRMTTSHAARKRPFDDGETVRRGHARPNTLAALSCTSARFVGSSSPNASRPARQSVAGQNGWFDPNSTLRRPWPRR